MADIGNIDLGSDKFYERNWSTSQFAFVRSEPQLPSILAAVTSAVNHLTSSKVLTPYNLGKICSENHVDPESLCDVTEIATRYAGEEAPPEIQVDFFRDSPNKSFDRFFSWVDSIHSKRIAIAMFEYSETPPPEPVRLGRFHPIVFFQRVRGGWDIWDVKGYPGQITHEELEQGFKYLDEDCGSQKLMRYLVPPVNYEVALLTEGFKPSATT
ncbi:MAG: hypothetical protein JNM18_16690 [Planctomycetaceae bacterium]|nr:hypothetical protein [Planctomycetaceae bacterium]